MENKKQIIQSIETVIQFAWGIFFLLFPLFFTPLMSDAFIIPKEALLAVVSLGSLVLFGIQTILDKKVKIRQTAFDLPVAVFLLVAFLSSIFAVNKFDSYIAVVPLVLLGISYFVLVNFIRREQTAFFLLASLVIGATTVSIIRIFTFLKVYLIPLPATHIVEFSTIGTLFDTVIYLVLLLPIALYFAYPLIKGKTTNKSLTFAVCSLLLLAGIGISFYQMLQTQRPALLPFAYGFQIAMASISQDAPRIAQGFFFGSGIGNFLTDFTRFKPVAFNLDNNLWYLIFTQSSSFVLELLATTGILGLLSFFFLIGRAGMHIKKTHKNPLFFPLLLVSILSFILPFSFTTIALLFFIFAMFAAVEGLKDPNKAVDLEFALIALRKTFFSGTAGSTRSAHTSTIMPGIFSVILIIIVGTIGYFSTRYVLADMAFQKSLVAANNNNGALTYQKQVEAITMFPYRDVFYRVFSQTNIAIGNSLLTLNTQKGAKPSEQVQNQILNLIQQAITVGRSATTIAPANAINWQNLASVYRSIVGLGQNADQFTIASMQQAINLDPANPQEYLTLGGFYYQLGQWDNAIRQFQVVINLKPDYPNAYYNLGHALEQKGDLQNALAAYQNVKTLVANNKGNTDKISADIAALQTKIGSQANSQTTQTPTPSNTTTQNKTSLKPLPSSEPLNLAQPTQAAPKPNL